MKKLFVFLASAGMLIACNSNTTTNTIKEVDSVVVDSVVVDTTTVDSVVIDSITPAQ